MKKYHFLFTALAVLALTTGCKKDQGLVTLSAHIDQPSKTYINDNRYPCWHNGDQVYINDAVYPIMSASGSTAQIENVAANSVYRAVFPASIVSWQSGDISNSPIVQVVNLPSIQHYELVGNHQRVDVPMGAYLTSGSTLQFHNLCSIVRVIVSNALNQELSLSRIVLQTENAALSGSGWATVYGVLSDHIGMRPGERHDVSLDFTGDYPASVIALDKDTFDIVVPEFTTDDVTITLYTTDGHSFSITKENVALAHNTITTVTLNVTSLTGNVAAELDHSARFNDAIPASATAVVFEYNSTVNTGTRLSSEESVVPIYGNLDGTTWRVSTAASVINAKECSYMFSGKTNITSIDFGEGFNTSNVTYMSGMFRNCSGLTSLDLSHFNTSNVMYMNDMFYYCNGLTNLDISNFNTSNVTRMDYMFNGCYVLTSLDVSHFNTSNVTRMDYIFCSCNALTSLDVSHFNTSNVTRMDYMFAGCNALTSLDVSHFNTSNVTNMAWMFSGCSGLTSLDVSDFNTGNVTSMNRMFQNCSSLTSLDVSNFITSDVTDMCCMFMNCSGLTSIDVSHFNTGNVTAMRAMFIGCSGLTSLNVSNFNTGNVTDMGCMFQDCSNLTGLDLSNFNTSNVVYHGMEYMFSGCSGLTSLDLSNFDMSHLGGHWNDGSLYSGKRDMCTNLATISGHCTITCSEATQSALESGTGLPTSGVTFTWVRPATSK